MGLISLNDKATQAITGWARKILSGTGTQFGAAQTCVRRLGAHWRDGRAEFGFWAPEITDDELDPAQVRLEILRPDVSLDWQADLQTVTFARYEIPLVQTGEFWWGVVDGLRPGRRDAPGDFYWLTYRDRDGVRHTVPDYLAYSIPFGSFAPAELYDVSGMFADRQDADHFAGLSLETDPDGVPRITAPTNILQIHPRTASKSGSLAGITRIYAKIAEKIRAGTPLTPAEQHYTGYDAIQLMPIEPLIEYEVGPRFWNVETETGDEVTVTLRRPDMTNWGYDVMLGASSATTPTVLESKRPDEFLDLIVTLHNFPGKPIAVILDIVYGHIDNQALPLLNKHFFAGANMYGQNARFSHPVVRALMLEMQRRKHNYGVDGVRVDGAQDFKNWNPETQQMEHDDAYLHLMNDVEQDVAEVRYRPWMIFEDGRPWPRDDWELSSTYREVTKQMPNVWQWGPLTFAHNTPFLFTFWISKWWRIREMTQVGSHWITGCANHDTLRRGTQVDINARINTYLGDTLPEIFQNAYDNPAAKLFDYAFMPGIPMDFINASMRAPWSFVRNTDDRYGVKVMAEEARFLHWVVNEARFAAEFAFPRLKALGFRSLEGLRRFQHALDHLVQVTDYDLLEMVSLLNHMKPTLDGPKLTVPRLKQIARAWMDDVHDYCNVTHYAPHQDASRAAYNRAVREFRRERPWLMDDLRPEDHFDYLTPCDGSVTFYGVRTAPDGGEQLCFVANMEGAPRTLIPAELPIPDLIAMGWQVALAAPGVTGDGFSSSLTLHDSQGVIFVRKRG